MRPLDMSSFTQFVERTMQNAGTTVKVFSSTEQPEGVYLALYVPLPSRPMPSPLIAQPHYALRRDDDFDNGGGYITRCACGGWFCDFEKHLSETG